MVTSEDVGVGLFVKRMKELSVMMVRDWVTQVSACVKLIEWYI